MATILKFRPGRSLRSGTNRTAAGVASADVLFFPGVRYEHWAHQKLAKPRRRSKKRDLIDIIDRPD